MRASVRRAAAVWSRWPMKRAARSTALEPIGLVLQRETGIKPPPAVETAPIAYRDWEAAVGSRIAARARPVRIDRGVLVVRTATSTWAQELALLSEPILAQLRARGVQVESLRFRVGHVDAPERPPLRDEVRTSPPDAPLPAEVQAQLAHIADPELRDAIAHAAAKNLGWQLTLKAKNKPRVPGSGLDTRNEKAKRATSTRSAARAPRSAGPGSAPPDRATTPSRGASRGKPGSR